MEDEKLAGAIIVQFILLMQNESVWPCRQSIGDAPQPLTAKEVMALKDKYKEMLRGEE